MFRVMHKGQELLFNDRQELEEWHNLQWEEFLTTHEDSINKAYAKWAIEDRAERQARKNAILRGELPRRITIKGHILCDDPVLHDSDLTGDNP